MPLNPPRSVVPVYIFDPRVFGGTTPRYGFPKTGGYRAKFILESIADLRNSLRQRGNDLVIRVGKPEEILPRLSQEFRAGWVFCNRERTSRGKTGTGHAGARTVVHRPRDAL